MKIIKYVNCAMKMALVLGGCLLSFCCATSLVSAEDSLGDIAVATPQPTEVPLLSNPTEERVLNVKEKDHGKDFFEFQWDKIENVAGYEIWKLDKINNGYNLYREVSENTFKEKDLKQGVKETFIVRGYRYNDQDQKEFTGFSDLIIMGTTPDDVKNFRVTRNSSSLIILEWDKVSEDASYVIYRKAENMDSEIQLITVNGTYYTDETVSPATGYSYRIVAICGRDDIVSESSQAIITSTTPKVVTITACKGGDKRIRIRWNKLGAGDGYKIYMKSGDLPFEMVANIGDIKTKEYIKTELLPNVTYDVMVVSYRMYNGVEYEAEQSGIMKATTTDTIFTSTKPALFSNLTKFKKSAVYKKYKAFYKKTTLKENFAMPGIAVTNVNGFPSTSMIAQAPCIMGKYILISAYDGKGEENSVVYVLELKTGRYVTTLVLPDSYHVGGMAYDGYNVWISSGKSISALSAVDINQAILLNQDSVCINYIVSKYAVDCQSSFISFYNNVIWVGTHNEKANSTMFGYKITKKATEPKLTLKYKMTIPSRTQDVEFISKKKIVISRANQINSSKYYISRLENHTLDWTKAAKNGTVSIKKKYTKITAPPLMEGVAYNKGYLYIVFESYGIGGCKYKTDRVAKVKYNNK